MNIEELVERYNRGERYFYDLYFENINISGISLSNAKLISSCWINCNLSNVDLSNSDLTLADFHNSTLIEVNLQQAKFDRTNFIKVDLSSANLENTSLRGILHDFKTNFPSGIELREAYLICAGNYLSNLQLSGTNLQNASLINAQLINTKFIKSNLKNANLKGAILKKANLKYAQLKKANLSYVNLNYANLASTNLAGANLENAILQNANLHYADIRGANLKNAKLIEANLQGTIYNSETILPDDIDLSTAYFSNKSIYTSSTNNTFVKQVKSPLLEALERINFEGEFYPGLTREEIDEITQDLPFSFPEELYELYQWHNGMKEPRGWDYCFVDTKEFLTLQEAINYTKNFVENDFYEDSWKPNWLYAFGEGTDNSYAYLLILGEEEATVLDCCPDTISVSVSYNSITQMMLEKAFWEEEANFSGANLAGVDLNGFYLRNIKFNDSNLEKANLSKTDLEGADFRGANLKEANLYKAKITDTNFTDAIFYKTIMPDGSIREA